MDAPLFYQLLIGELELQNGQPATAYAVVLDAARRTRDSTLFRRAVDIAVKAQAGEEALVAVRAWREALPGSLEAVRTQVQILLALNRPTAMVEPLQTLIELSPLAERPGVIGSIPRLFSRHRDQSIVANVAQQVLKRYAEAEATRVPAQLAMARVYRNAGQSAAALAIARHVQERAPSASGPALLALELMDEEREAEALVRGYLGREDAEAAVRMAYAQTLLSRQRYAEAARQYEGVTRSMPELAPARLALGMLQLDLGRPREAEVQLLKFVELKAVDTPVIARPLGGPGISAVKTDNSENDKDDDDGNNEGPRDDAGLSRAWLLLGQIATDRRDFALAQQRLDKAAAGTSPIELNFRRGLVLARQGQIDQARALIQSSPAPTDEARQARLLAEAQLLRTLDRWADARRLLQQAMTQFPDQPDVLYELAMVEEHLKRHDQMERLLRRVIEVKPDHHHAHNALGYSLADRGLRLGEARTLVQRALELAPGNPFITDSLGWVAYREGRLDEAASLLRQAYEARPDAEIGVHLGEVLWKRGEREEALRLWREVRERDRDSALLKSTLARLKADL